MKRNIAALFAGVSLTALLVGGCANKDVVKSDESLVPRADTSRTDTTRIGPAKPVVNPEPEVVAAVERQPSKVTEAVSAFETVYFDYDKADLSKESRDVLSKNGAIIMKSKTIDKVKIEGHCDERGSTEYNLALGERRAKSALQYLVTLGVKADRLSIISYGKEKPAAKGGDEAAWSKNRRAEFVVVK
jgi:peptidoglycan-associated lipoprotein